MVSTHPGMQPASRNRRAFIRDATLFATSIGIGSHTYASGSWPARPVRLLVPVPAGGAVDTLCRALATAVSATLQQPVVVENRAGASATLAAAAMAQAPTADGYMLGVAPATVFKLPHLQKLPYDPLKDLTYILAFTSLSHALLVGKDAPWRTAQEFIAHARSHPGKLSIGTSGTGSSGHMAVAALLQQTGIEATFVPFKGGVEVLQALQGGHISAMLDAGWTLAEKSGARFILSFTEKRAGRFPNVPTASELGIRVRIRSPLGILGPKGMDAQVVSIVHDAFKAALTTPAYRATLAANDLEDDYLTGAQYLELGKVLFAEERESLRKLGLLAT